MSDVCLLHIALLADAFEAKLARALTSAERGAIERMGGTTAEEVESELERAPDAASAALLLQRLQERERR